MHKRLWLVLSLLVLLVSPSYAFAGQTLDSAVSGFQSGLGTWNKDDETELEQKESFEPLEFSLTATGNPVYNAITGVARSFTRLKIGKDTVGLWQFIIYVLMGRLGVSAIPATWTIMPVCLALIFMWWGLRKSVRMFFKAFRKGRIDG